MKDRVIVFGARPGKVKEMIKIDLPRPRDLSIKRDPKFLQLDPASCNGLPADDKEGVDESMLGV